MGYVPRENTNSGVCRECNRLRTPSGACNCGPGEVYSRPHEISNIDAGPDKKTALMRCRSCGAKGRIPASMADNLKAASQHVMSMQNHLANNIDSENHKKIYKGLFAAQAAKEQAVSAIASSIGCSC